MFEDLLEDINTVTRYEKGDRLSPINNAYFPAAISKANFHPIPTISEALVLSTKMCFIDGGSTELLRAPNFSLFFIRIYANIMLNKKTVDDKKIEFYCLAKTKIKEGKIFYDVNLLVDDMDKIQNNDKFNSIDDNKNSSNSKYLPAKEDLELFSFDKTIVVGENRAEISKLGEVARRFAELRLATVLIDEANYLKSEDIIILDGNLRATYTNETKYLNELYKKAKPKNIIITGLCKTSNLLTEKGNNIINVLNHLALENDEDDKSKANSQTYQNSKTWYYYPIFDIQEPKHKAEMMFVKLNASSEYIFRFEINKDQFNFSNIKDIEEVFTLLTKNSNDYSFPGYPYGLVKADQMARISNQEKDFLRSKILFSMKNKKDFDNMKQCLNALNAHDVLDGK
ncbi:MAG: DNA double-strand break repair nuclease NurA [Candidatus Woesearchaeota archaeon]